MESKIYLYTPKIKVCVPGYFSKLRDATLNDYSNMSIDQMGNNLLTDLEMVRE